MVTLTPVYGWMNEWNGSFREVDVQPSKAWVPLRLWRRSDTGETIDHNDAIAMIAAREATTGRMR